MSNYTKTTDFEAKDSLPSGDNDKIIKGAEFETEFDAISTAIATKADTAGPTFTGTATFATTNATTVQIGGVAITSTAAELNTLDGITSTTAELNTLDGFTGTVDDLNYAKDLRASGVTGDEFDILDGLTATAAELNILDGATLSTAELNLLDGVTATTAELNILDGVTSTGIELNILDGVTATTAELNLLDGITATTTELNYVDGVTSSIQSQIDTKSPIASPTFTGTVTIPTADINGGAVDGVVIGGTTAAAGSFTTVSATGNITVDGTVDGRDVATDGTKLDGIEASATADQTDAEIRAAVEAATDSNVFTDADHTKLDGIEALADVTDTTNVTAAGALMDSELTNLTAVKSLDQGVATTDTPTFAGLATTADVSFADNDKAIFGASGDLQIYHDGSNSYIKDAGTGDLIIQASDDLRLQTASGTNMAVFTENTYARLFYNGTARFETTNTGIDVTGVITTDGMTTSADINFGDNDKAVFGAGSDLQIYHDGANSFIEDTDIGSLFLKTNGAGVYLYSGSEALATFNSNGANNFYYDNALKLSTTSTGIDVTGSVVSDGLTLDNNGSVIFNAPQATDTVLIGTNDNDLVLRTDDGDIILKTNENKQQLKVSNNGDISFYEDTGTTAKLFWDASAESLGIGTSSPSGALDIGGQHILYDNYDALGASFTRNGAYGSVLSLGRQGVSSGVTLDYPADNTFALSTNSTERMRIDSSGNLLVGKTSSGLNTAGFEVASSGRTRLTRDSANVVEVNRTTNDGSLVTFSKDGTSVGSIGVDNSDNLYISGGSGHGGVEFGTNAVIPSSNGVAADATVKLGNANYRYTDLYLSGGVYLGGTGSANKLDDYEEGTWTPVYLPSSGSFTTLTMDVIHATYTKVGNLVTAKAFVRTDDVDVTGASGDLYLSGLPFTPTNYEAVSLDYGIGWAGQTPLSGHTQQASTYINLMYRDTADADNVTSKVTDMTDGTTANRNRLMITAVYQTAA